MNRRGWWRRRESNARPIDSHLGAGAGTRTRMSVGSGDFKFPAPSGSANGERESQTRLSPAVERPIRHSAVTNVYRATRDLFLA